MTSHGRIRPNLVPAICRTSMLMVGLDVTILNVALPSIRRDFGASVSGAQWTIGAHTLVIVCLLTLSGSPATGSGGGAPSRPGCSPSRSAG